jgi:cell division protein FtsL
MAKLRSRGRNSRKLKDIRSTKRKTVSQKVRESESLLVLLTTIFLCVVGISYILQTNSIATRGYEVEQYESQLSKLKNENQNMKNQEAELRSIKNLEPEKGRLTAVASSDINYVTAGKTAVAMRQ